MSDAIFHANLGALRAWTPVVATVLEGTTIPEEWTAVRGTDGTATFSRVQEGGRVEWLGGTSMPRTSAGPLTGTMDVAGREAGNGVFLSVGTGYEIRSLAGRLGGPQMLFVLETDAVLARLALTVCDLSDLLAVGKVVLLLGNAEALGSQLAGFLEGHPGFEPPGVIHPLATLPQARRHGLLALGEQLIRTTVAARGSREAALSAELATLTPEAGHVLALSLTPSAPGALVVPELVAALAEEEAGGYRMRHLVLDGHQSSSSLVRMQAVCEHRPAVILTDLFRSQLGMALPAKMTIHTFVPAVPAADYWESTRRPEPGSLAPDDRIYYQFPGQRQLLLAGHLPESQLVHLPLAINVPGRAEGARGEEAPTHIALQADLPSLDAATYGLTLPTHAALFNAGRELLAELPLPALLSLHPDMVPDLFRRVQARCGVAVNDAGLTASLLRVLRHVLLPAVPVIALARHLAEAGLPLKLLGSNWPEQGFPASTLYGALDGTKAEGAGCWSQVAVVVQFSPEAAIHPLVLQAAFQGVPVVAPAHPWDGQAGALPTLLRANRDFVQPTAGQLVTTLKSLRRDAGRRKELADSAAAQTAAHHTWRQRLPLVLGTLWQGGA